LGNKNEARCDPIFAILEKPKIAPFRFDEFVSLFGYRSSFFLLGRGVSYISSLRMIPIHV
jgi:hypothetical protein